MVINVEKLKKAGMTVRIFEQYDNDDQRPVKNLTGVNVLIEIYPSTGEGLKEGTLEDVRSRLNTPEYQDVTVDGLIRRVQTFQVLETIEATSKDA